MAKLTFDGSLATLKGKLNTSRNGIQLHLLNMGILAVEYKNLEGYVQKTVELLDEMGEHTHAEAALLWIEKYYGYTATDEGKQAEWFGVEFVRSNFNDAKECKFWTLAPKKQSSFKAFNSEDAIYAALATIDKKAKAKLKMADDDAANTVIDFEQVKRVRAAMKAA
jgi:hypothetical protein